jgi:hypothetical protein
VGKVRRPNFHECGIVWRRGSDSNRRVMVLQTIPLGHLGTAPLFVAKSMPKIYARFYAQCALLLPFYPESRRSNPLIPRNAESKEGFCRPLPWATWVPRQTSEYNKSLVGEGLAPPGHLRGGPCST